MRFYSYFCLFIFIGFDPQKNMYDTIAKNLLEFREMDALPTAPKKRLVLLSPPEKFSNLLMDKRTGFHKSCTVMYNKQKLERKRKNQKTKHQNRWSQQENDKTEYLAKKLFGKLFLL